MSQSNEVREVAPQLTQAHIAARRFSLLRDHDNNFTKYNAFINGGASPLFVDKMFSRPGDVRNAVRRQLTSMIYYGLTKDDNGDMPAHIDNAVIEQYQAIAGYVYRTPNARTELMEQLLQDGTISILPAVIRPAGVVVH